MKATEEEIKEALNHMTKYKDWFKLRTTEDDRQEIMIKFILSYDSTKKVSPKTWIGTLIKQHNIAKWIYNNADKRKGIKVVELDRTYDESNDPIYVVETNDTYEGDDELIKERKNIVITKLMETLTDKQRLVITQLYLNDGLIPTNIIFKTLMRVLGITKQSVSQLHIAGLRNIRKQATKLNIDEETFKDIFLK